MKINTKRLPKSPELLEKIIIDLAEKLENQEKIIELSKVELSIYKEKYARLIEEIRLAKQQRFAHSSEKNVLQPDLFDEAGIELPEEVKGQITEEEVQVESYARKKHPVRRKLPAYLPREVLVHDIPEEEKICSCGELLVRTYDYAQADETTVQVLDEVGRDNRTKSYMWCYRGGGEKPSIVYEYQETRGGYHAQRFLKDFKGYLQTDAYSGYYWTDNDKNIISVGCHAHARRPFAELAKLNKGTGLAAEALKFYRKLYKVEKIARENNLSAESRCELRQKQSQPVLDTFKIWLDHHLTKTSEQGKIGKAIRYCLNHWIELNNYLKDGRIEIDNNLIENTIRPFVLGRKNWLFMGSPTGAKAGAIFYSLIETCKANNIEPYQYLCAMMNRIRECVTEDDYRKLLPQFIQV
jgi:hypothetical protein